MAKKYIQKALSVGLSLTLCAGLVVPSFAASFTDLKNVIDTGEAYESEKGGIAVSTDENGTRNITLNEEVTDYEKKGCIEIAENQKVVLDLNGQTITGKVKWDATLVVRGGDLTLKDSTAKYDEDGNQTSAGDGKVTGGGHAGVWVEANGSFTMEGGTIEANNSHNYTDGRGPTSSGVGVTGEGSNFTMTGGTIANNNGNGPAVAVMDGASFDMEDGLIESNATGKTDCVSVEGDNSSFTMTGGEINATDGGKTVMGDASKVAIRGGTFSSLDDEYLPMGHTLVDGVFTHPWGAWANNGDGTQTHTCLLRSCGASETEKAETPAAPVAPAAPAAPVDGPEFEIDDPVIDIDDPAVPLAAGPVTCGEFIDYLWRHEDEPEADIVVDHEYAPAISWALSIDIISDDSFEPDELVTVAAVRDILTNYAQYLDMAMPELTTLTGEEDEAVLNCDEVLAEFFGEERSE